ncbi:hydrogenase nickel incorporation protein HypB [Mangrovitalea sediminis]|uniref:hydrogenase nickel incorporation protein HypB n=1 Tax=Mangrovitalea sediminis TaxID=1982043 RepID=UPI000BE5074C|nr:hydrogenase nickel incorporation protein HypB [Mangrovitalea sediminis]
MCQDCGCSLNGPAQRLAPLHRPETQTLPLLQSLHLQNQAVADDIRNHFAQHQVLAINLMSSPGAGKTTLLEATLAQLASEFRCAVLEGDLETDLDAQRIRAQGVPALQITTGNACHLDAQMIKDALEQLDLANLDIVFIENVGNLVCPASFDLGQHANVILLSVTEGDDKPAKYPVMFRAADLVLISKIDLLPYLGDFDPARAEAFLRRLASQAPVMPLSARQGEGLETWFGWLRDQRRSVQTTLAAQSA